ncbi:MAG: hypothetical protein EHM12_11175 [Dehalococcoidia bacterium]|nr:MAG: hypothetical protein EHM12_11175 [Dehalococcoidia bacterium]
MSKKEYEPFGEEWKKEVMKMKKIDIVELLIKANCEKINNCNNYTRLCVYDKNGTKIKVGDIVRYHKHTGYILPDMIGTIQYNPKKLCVGFLRHSENFKQCKFYNFYEIDELEKDFLSHLEKVNFETKT